MITDDADVESYGDTTIDEDDYLSVSCGCPTPSPLPLIGAPSPGSTGACGESASFSIASETLPGAEGCFLETAESINGETIYTTSGTLYEEQARMIAMDVNGEDASKDVSVRVENPCYDRGTTASLHEAPHLRRSSSKTNITISQYTTSRPHECSRSIAIQQAMA